MKNTLVNVTEILFGTAHLATVVAGKAIAYSEAAILKNHREIDGKKRNLETNVAYRELRSEIYCQVGVNKMNEALNKLNALREARGAKAI